MSETKTSSAVHPLVKPHYPEVDWSYTDIFGLTTNFDRNGNVVEDESKWRNYSIHIKPQTRFEAAYKKGNMNAPAGIKVAAARANASSEIFNTIDTRAVFHVKELIYPGDIAVEVVGKWIYAIHTDSLEVLAEVFAESANLWHFRYNPEFPKNMSLPLPENKSDGKLELPMINASESGTIIGFFISPFRLTADAIDFLTEDAERLKAACVRPVRENAEKLFAAVPDPYQWSADAHEKYYIPLLDEWQEYVFEPQRQARFFIATTLKAWIETVDKGLIYDSKDPLDIEDELKEGEPDKFIRKYKKEELELSRAAEKAAAYLSHCVYAPEHRTVEKAALEAEGLALTLSFQNWAVVAERATESAQGRMFAVAAFRDVERLPNKFIFSEKAIPPLSEKIGVNFPNSRYAWQAAISLAGDLMPAVIKDITDKKIRENMITYLERLGIEKGTLSVPKGMPEYLKHKAGKTLYNQLKQNRELTEGLTHKKTVERVERLFEKIAKEPEVAQMPESVTNTPLYKMNKQYGESFVGRNRLKIAFVFETINVMTAIADFNESNRKVEWNNDKFVSLLGASADFTAAFAEPVFKQLGIEGSSLVQKIGGGKFIAGKAVGGIAGIVGGICQMTDEQRQTVEGFGNYDFGVGTGHGIAAAGAAITAIGGGLVLAEAVGIGAAAGGPIGAVIGAVGAGMIIGGNLLAAWLKDKPHEQFARFSFLGKQYDTIAHQVYELNEKLNNYNPLANLAGRAKYQRTPLYTEWSSEGAIPTDDILKEARLLIWLLSGFSMELERAGAGDPTRGNNHNPDAYVKIIPGYLSPAAKIEIKLEQTYVPRNGSDFPEKFEATLLFDQTTDEIIFMHGNMVPFMKHNVVKRDQFGNLEYIKFAIRPEQVRFHGAMTFEQYLSFQGIQRYPKSSIVNAQISMGKVYQPSAAKYLQLKTLEEDKVNSGDSSHWN